MNYQELSHSIVIYWLEATLMTQKSVNMREACELFMMQRKNMQLIFSKWREFSELKPNYDASEKTWKADGSCSNVFKNSIESATYKSIVEQLIKKTTELGR